jgi:methionyl-tRNA synthetase
MGFVHCDHEYLNCKDGKFSKSRGAFVEVPYFLSKYDPDPLRFPCGLFIRQMAASDLWD